MRMPFFVVTEITMEAGFLTILEIILVIILNLILLYFLKFRYQTQNQ